MEPKDSDNAPGLISMIAILIFAIFAVALALTGIDYFTNNIVVSVFVLSAILGGIGLFLSKYALNFTQYYLKRKNTSQKVSIKPIQVTIPKLKTTIVEILTNDQSKKNFATYGILLGGWYAFAIITYAIGQPFNISIFIFVMLLIVARLADYFLLKYRINQNHYATNEYEARELIALILKHSDKSDFSDGDGLKDLIPEPKLAHSGKSVLVPSLED
jgi:hypothetical protein